MSRDQEQGHLLTNN